tara:strand:- start:878 stop:1012 length:135 start_codon:yes stop_codon:yes gene_type:complete
MDWWQEQEQEAERRRKLLEPEETGPDPERFLTGRKTGHKERNDD